MNITCEICRGCYEEMKVKPPCETCQNKEET